MKIKKKCIRRDPAKTKIKPEVKLMTVGVLRAILEERAYQERVWPGHQHTVGEWLLILEKCLNDGKRAWMKAGDLAALHEIRQVTAVGAAALQQCGAPLRIKASS